MIFFEKDIEKNHKFGKCFFNKYSTLKINNMSDKKISELNELTTTPNSDDLLAIVNNNETKKIRYETLMSGASGGGGLPNGMEFITIPAGEIAPDGEYYYNILTDTGVNILQGELFGSAIQSLDILYKSKNRIDHAINLITTGWHQSFVENEQINDSAYLGEFTSIVAVSESGKIYKSYDGCQTWILKHTGNNYIKKIAFFDDSTTTSRSSSSTTTTGFLCAVGGQTIYYSFDLGETWYQVTDSSTIRSDMNEEYTDIIITDSGRGYNALLLGSFGSVVVVEFGNPVIFKFSESLPQTSSIPYYKYIGFSRMSDSVALVSYFYAICNLTDSDGITSGHLFKGNTTSGYTEYLTINDGQLNAIWFNDANNGYVAGAQVMANAIGIIYKTIDGGDNFTIPTLPSESGALKDITSYKTNVWAVGDNSTVLYSTDSGITWFKDEGFINDISNSNNLLSVCAISKALINITGDSSGQGYYYYYIPDVLDGVTYQFIPVDTIWLKVKQSAGFPPLGGGSKEVPPDVYKYGFVCALNVTI